MSGGLLLEVGMNHNQYAVPNAEGISPTRAVNGLTSQQPRDLGSSTCRR